MNSVRYIKMWTEENHNNYDLLPIIRNYGPKMVFGISVKEAIAYSKDFHAEFYLREDELKELGDKGYDFYVHKDGLKQLSNHLENDIPAVYAAIRHLISLNLENLSNKELFQEYLNYVRPYGDLMGSYIVTQPHFVAKIEQELKNKLIQFSNQDELFAILTSSPIEFIFSDKGSFFKKSFAELIGSEDAELEMTILDVPLYEERLIDGSKKERVIKENSLSDDSVVLANILSGIGEMRLKMRFVWMPAIYFLELFLIELKRRYKISKSTIRRYDADEFDDLIMEGNIVDEAVLKERSSGFAKVLQGGEIKTLVGEDANKLIESINKINSEVKEIKGLIASKGFARGKVVILSYTESFEHSEKIKKMSEGDILVSEMTRPNIIIACQKAGAIITDEGGITCHAAIVARELKKPCIIGTKFATQLLKDGDIVEVDANQGVVRILKKA